MGGWQVPHRWLPEDPEYCRLFWQQAAFRNVFPSGLQECREHAGLERYDRSQGTGARALSILRVTTRMMMMTMVIIATI